MDEGRAAEKALPQSQRRAIIGPSRIRGLASPRPMHRRSLFALLLAATVAIRPWPRARAGFGAAGRRRGWSRRRDRRRSPLRQRPRVVADRCTRRRRGLALRRARHGGGESGAVRGASHRGAAAPRRLGRARGRGAAHRRHRRRAGRTRSALAGTGRGRDRRLLHRRRAGAHRRHAAAGRARDPVARGDPGRAPPGRSHRRHFGRRRDPRAARCSGMRST